MYQRVGCGGAQDLVGLERLVASQVGFLRGNPQFAGHIQRGTPRDPEQDVPAFGTDQDTVLDQKQVPAGTFGQEPRLGREESAHLSAPIRAPCSWASW